MSDYTVCYMPPDYGAIIPQSECRHDPAGHRMELGLRIEPVGKKRKQCQVVIDGQFCMKCGWCWHMDIDNGNRIAEPGSADWWHVWNIAQTEFGGKCWQFACRLSQLGEEVGHLSRLLGIGQCRSQRNAQNALKVVRHHCYRKRAPARPETSLKFRMPRVRWAQWPDLYGRAA